MAEKIQVRYTVQYATQEVTQAEYDHVLALFNLREPQKVLAYKFIRQQYGIGLKEAKDVCDAIGEYGKLRPRQYPCFIPVL